MLEYIPFISEGKINQNVLKNSVIYHPILSDIPRFESVVTNYDFEDKDLNIIFKLLLNTKIETVINKLNNFVKDNFEKKYVKEELVSELVAITSQMIEEYELKFKQSIYNIMMDLATKNGVKEDVVDSSYELSELILVAFNKFHNKNIEWIFCFIDMLKDTKIVQKNNEIVKQYMDIIKIAVKISVFDAERVFKNFNGNLHGLLDTYR
jgi:hypothetical protein